MNVGLRLHSKYLMQNLQKHKCTETWGKAGSNDGVFKLRLYSFRSGNSIDRVIASGNDPSIKTETQVAGKVWDFYAKTFEVAEIYLNRRHFGWAMSLERSDSSQ